MKQYLKISTGKNVMYYPEFRSAELTIFPWYEEGYRIDLDLSTFGGDFNAEQAKTYQEQVDGLITNPFSNLCLRLACGIVETQDLDGVKLAIQNGSNEEEGLVQLCVDWVIYLRNISIEFKEIDGHLYTIWKAESEDIDNYSSSGLNTTYELVAKIDSVTRVKNYQELLTHSKEFVKQEVRYKKIIAKMKGEQPSKVKLESIMPLNRPFMYNDSIVAWGKVGDTAKEEELPDPFG